MLGRGRGSPDPAPVNLAWSRGPRAWVSLSGRGQGGVWAGPRTAGRSPTLPRAPGSVRPGLGRSACLRGAPRPFSSRREASLQPPQGRGFARGAGTVTSSASQAAGGTVPRCFLPKSRPNEARSGHWTRKRVPTNRAVFSAPPLRLSPLPSSSEGRGAGVPDRPANHESSGSNHVEPTAVSIVQPL